MNGIEKKPNFEYARKARDKAIQQDIFSDYKKPVIFNLILGALFFLLSLTAMFVSSEIKNILLLILVACALVLVVSCFLLIKKLMAAETVYRNSGEELLKKAEKQ